MASGAPLRVKFMAKGCRPGDETRWQRQLPGDGSRWGACDFIFDPDATAYDWLVVYDDLAPVGTERFSSRAEMLPCPRDHTLLITAEPASIKTYGRAFCDQFGWVLTSQEPWALEHPGVIHAQTGYRWFYGAGGNRYIEFDTLASLGQPQKTGLISTLCSTKAQRHTLHHQRLEFTRALAEALPELDVFGRGHRPVADKREALDPYRYHVAIENHVAPHHFTEKLADAFLGWTLPIYHGAPDVRDYFPPESVLPIDMLDPAAAAEQINEAIAEHRFEKALPAIVEARRRVLHEYNLFAVIERFVTQRHGDGKQGMGEQILGRRRARMTSPWKIIGHLRERQRVRKRLRRR